MACVFLGSTQTGYGYGQFLNTWRGLYPASTTSNAVSCATCHAGTGGGSPWNAYGWSIRQALIGGVWPGYTDIETAIRSVEDLDADGEGNTNLAEINAGTQPGWRTGNNNTFYPSSGSPSVGNAPISEATNPDPVFFALSWPTPLNGSITGATSGQQIISSQVVNLTAVPAPGFAFAGWTGDVPPADVRDSTLALTMTGSKSIAAVFYKDTTGVLAYSEALSGDLSGVFASPTPVSLLLGANAITGQIGNNGFNGSTNGQDADYLVVTVPAGQQISSITIDSYTFSPTDPGVSFAAYVAASTFAGQQAGNITGDVLFNAASGEVLDDLAGGSLGPGTYAFWLQETSTNVVDYQLTLTLVPVTYTLSLPNPVNGTVTGASNGQQIVEGQVVNLTAVPAVGYAFAGWSGDVPPADVRDSTLALTMNASKNIVGLFYKNTGGTLAYSEALSGDLSGVYASPTPVSLLLGANAITGQIGNNGFIGSTNGQDADYFVVTVPAGQQISSITIDSYTFSQNNPGVSYAAYVAASAFAGQQEGDITGDVLFNATSGEVLDDFTGGPLGPGTYAFWFQETSPNVVNYQLTVTLQVTPPTSYALGWSAPVNGFITGASNGQQIGVGQVVNLIAVPSAGFVFSSWTGDVPLADVTDITLALTMNGDKNIGATFVPNTRLSAGGVFTAFEEARLKALIQRLQVGDVFIAGPNGTVGTAIDLSFLAPPSSTSESKTTLAMANLPPGLKFDPVTRLITGTITGELASLSVTISKTRTAPAPALTQTIELTGVTVQPFQLAGAYEALIRDSANPTLPVGKVSLTITGPRAFSATLERVNQARRKSTGPLPVSPTALTSQVRVRFAGSGNGAAAIKPTWVSFNLVAPTTSDLVGGVVEDVIQLSPVAVNQTYALETAANATTFGSLQGFRLAEAGRSPELKIAAALENGFNGNRTSTPGGVGYGIGTLNSSGSLALASVLGDGVKATLGLRLSQTNQAVVWAQPYLDKTQSFIGGIIDIGTSVSLGQPIRGNTRPSEQPGGANATAAGLLWRKYVPSTLTAPGVLPAITTPAALAARRAKELSYLDGFGVVAPLPVNAQVAKWVSVSGAESLALSLGLKLREVFVTTDDVPTAAVDPTGALNNATPVYPEKLALRNDFKLVRLLPTNSSLWAGNITPSTGVFGGSIAIPLPSPMAVQVSPVSGVLLQDESFGDQVGAGMIKIPVRVGQPNGSTVIKFETATIRLWNDPQP